MKKLHKIIAASLLVASASTGSSVVLAESALTGNVGVTSNYMWRGTTQTNDASAVSGGIDYSASGITVGTWVSNTTPGGYEQDIYASYSFDAGPVGLEVGYISYLNPVADTDSSEVYVNASYDMFNFGYADDSDNNNTYMSVGAEFEVKKDLTLAITLGDNDAAGTAGDYSHTTLSLSKGDFTAAYDTTDQADTAGNARFSVSWSQGFDL